MERVLYGKGLGGGAGRTRRLAVVLLAGVALCGARAAAAAELVMFEQFGCPWCEKFEVEIEPGYPDSEAGQVAPLRKVDIHSPPPADLRNIDPVVFTPTFVLVEDGEEIGRLTGYPGRKWFYPEIELLLEKLPDRASGTP